jgi:6-phosphogluconate dehydrogenase
MVHNGIEYGDMQVLAEAHTLLRAAGHEPAAQADLFRAWNRGRLESYLVEITADILAARDPEGGGPLIDVILDTAGQKGTGRWTVSSAMELGQPLLLVAEAVGARMISSLLDLRASTAARHPAADVVPLSGLIGPDDAEAAVWMAKVISYAQGFMVLRAASDEHGWELDLAAVAGLWRAGCIIRARFLADIAAAHRSGTVTNLLVTDRFAGEVREAAPSLRRLVGAAVRAGVPIPALASALTFYDGLRTSRGSGYLIQAQRDYFGAHTYERVDRPRGEFYHTDWVGSGDSATSGSYRA